MADMKWALALTDMISGPAKSMASVLKGVATALVDVGGPAKQIEASLDGVNKSLHGVDVSAKGAQASMRGTFAETAKLNGWAQDSAGKWRDALGKFVPTKQLQAAGLAVAGGGGGSGDMFSGISDQLAEIQSAAGPAIAAIGAVAKAVAAVTIALGAMAAAATVAFAKTAIQAGVFRENSLISLEVLLKDKTAAMRVYKDAVKFAADTPFESQDVISLYQKLLSVGFKEGDLKQVATALGDMAASKGMDKQIMNQLADSFGKLKALGHLDGDMINSLVSAGVDTGKVYSEIAKLMGKSEDEVRKLQSQGKISSDVAQKAILTVIENTFGGTMAKLSKTLSGLWSSLVSRPFEMLDAAFDSKGGLHDWYEELKKSVSWLGEKFDPTSDQGAKVIGFINLFGSGLKALTQILSGFGKGIFEGLANGLPNLKGDGLGDAEKAAKGFQVLGEAIGTAIGYMVSGAAAVAKFVSEHKTLLNVVLIVGAIFAFFVAAIILVIAAIVGFVAVLALAAGAMAAFIPLAIGGFMTFCTVVVTAIVSAFLGAIYLVYSYLDEIVGTVLVFGASVYSAAVGLGTSFRDGVVGAIQSAAGAIHAAIQAAIDTSGLSIKIPDINLPGGGTGGGGGVADAVKRAMSPASEAAPGPVGSKVPSSETRVANEAGIATATATSVAGGRNVTIQNLTIQASNAEELRSALYKLLAEIDLSMNGATA